MIGLLATATERLLGRRGGTTPILGRGLDFHDRITVLGLHEPENLVVVTKEAVDGAVLILEEQAAQTRVSDEAETAEARTRCREAI